MSDKVSMWEGFSISLKNLFFFFSHVWKILEILTYFCHKLITTELWDHSSLQLIYKHWKHVSVSLDDKLLYEWCWYFSSCWLSFREGMKIAASNSASRKKVCSERKNMPVINNFLCFVGFDVLLYSIMFNTWQNWVKNKTKPVMITEGARGGWCWCRVRYVERWKDKQEIYRQIASKFSIQVVAVVKKVEIEFLTSERTKDGKNKSKINLLTLAMEFSLWWKKPKKKPSHTRDSPARNFLDLHEALS